MLNKKRTTIGAILSELILKSSSVDKPINETDRLMADNPTDNQDTGFLVILNIHYTVRIAKSETATYKFQAIVEDDSNKEAE